MSDLEQQRRVLAPSPHERSLNGGGQIPALTPEQRTLADSLSGTFIASALERLAKDNARWFTRATLGASGDTMKAVHAGEQLGLWKKADGKNYYIFTRLTRPWMLTALALHDERVRSQSGPTKPQ